MPNNEEKDSSWASQASLTQLVSKQNGESKNSDSRINDGISEADDDDDDDEYSNKEEEEIEIDEDDDDEYSNEGEEEVEIQNNEVDDYGVIERNSPPPPRSF